MLFPCSSYAILYIYLFIYEFIYFEKTYDLNSFDYFEVILVFTDAFFRTAVVHSNITHLTIKC